MFLPINLISGALIVVMGVVLPQHLAVILFDYRRGLASTTTNGRATTLVIPWLCVSQKITKVE